jgi:transcriptional regulator with XRE-family HTH domain
MKLADYLSQSKITPAAFAAEIGVTRKAVDYWLAGKRLPRIEQLQAIATASKGAVTPNDFIISQSTGTSPPFPQEAAE